MLVTVTVLVVDDSKLARMLVARTISAVQPDWAVVEARDAESALDAFRQGSIDVAIIDYNMPGRNGLAFTWDIRQLSRDMPIALITANHQDEIVDYALEMNVVFIEKPPIKETLTAFLLDAQLFLNKAPATK